MVPDITLDMTRITSMISTNDFKQDFNMTCIYSDSFILDSWYLWVMIIPNKRDASTIDISQDDWYYYTYCIWRVS